MREIKFRCWSEYLNRMFYHPYIGAERDQVNDIFNGKLNKFHWMQFTGSKDIRRKDIYENDIIKENHTGLIYVIEYNDGSFGYSTALLCQD